MRRDKRRGRGVRVRPTIRNKNPRIASDDTSGTGWTDHRILTAGPGQRISF